jgi:hypothetical protein
LYEGSTVIASTTFTIDGYEITENKGEYLGWGFFALMAR